MFGFKNLSLRESQSLMGPTTTGFAVPQHIFTAKRMKTCCGHHSKSPLVLLHASTPTHRRGALAWSRRSVFTAVISVMPWLLETSRNEDISGAVSKIQRECAPFISKMENSRKFLYRGGQLKAAGKIQQEESDLLDPSTYSEEGALYFQALDAWIHDHGELAGLGHIAVADILEAGHWGEAMSCWPRGEVSYLWLSGSRLLFDDTLAHEQQLCSDTDTFCEYFLIKGWRWSRNRSCLMAISPNF